MGKKENLPECIAKPPTETEKEAVRLLIEEGRRRERLAILDALKNKFAEEPETLEFLQKLINELD